MKKGGDNSWFLYPPKNLQFLTLLIFYSKNIYIVSDVVYCNFFAINRIKMAVVNINQFWFCCCCSCASLVPALRSLYFREIKKMGTITILVLNYVPS